MTYKEIAAGILDVVEVWDRQQKPLMDFCERAKLIYRPDEFIDSPTINLLRYGLESPSPSHVQEPIFHEPTFHAPDIDFWTPPTHHRNRIGF